MQVVGVRTGAVAIALTILVSLVAVAGREPLRDTGGEPAEAPQQPVEVTVPPPAEFPVPGALPPEVFVFEAPEPGTPAWLVWTIVAIGVVGLLAAGVALFRELRRAGWRLPARRRRARAPSEARESGAEADLAASTARRAVEAAAEPLRAPADPRAAVIEAYARMEQVLAERDFGRRTPEAPREYLGRVLRERGMPERSLITLTELFEEARFSLHPIPESAPRRALGELEKTRRRLSAIDEGG
jgi:Domain of unknown function (DUF4129)